MLLLRILALILLLASCSSDRILSKEEATTEEPSNLKKSPEIFTIKSEADLPIVTKEGTEIDLNMYYLVLAKDLTEIDFPIRVEVTELRSPAEIILQGMNSTGRGQLLGTDGHLLVEIYKGKDKVKLSSQGGVMATMTGFKDGHVDIRHKLYFADGYDELLYWDFTRFEGFCFIGLKDQMVCKEIEITDHLQYQFYPGSLSWHSVAWDMDLGDVTPFAIKGGSKNTRAYLYFPDLQAIVDLKNEWTTPVPIRRQAILFAFERYSEEEYAVHYEELTVQPNTTINLKLEKKNMYEFATYLDKINP